MKGISRKFLLAFASLTLSIVVAELCLSWFVQPGFRREKAYVKVNYGIGICYSSNKNGYFPIDLNREIGREALRERMVSDEADRVMTELADATPYCIVLDWVERKRGFFREREKEVAIVGDSFAFGSGVLNEDTLGYLLGLRFTSINFKNFGWPGFNISAVSKQVSEVLEKHPDVETIVYVYNLNDSLMSRAMVGQERHIVTFQHAFLDNVKREDLFLDPKVLAYSRILYLIQKLIIMRKEGSMTINWYRERYLGPLNRDRMNETIEVLIEMRDRAKRGGVRFHVAIYPLMYKDIFGRYPFLEIHDFLMSVCEEHDLSCIDLYRPFESTYSLRPFTVHPADFHPNAAANKRVAEHLAEAGLLDQ